MSNKDEKSERPTSPSRRKEGSLGAALEVSLQAGLQSLSDGLGDLVEDSTNGPAPGSRMNLSMRPSSGRDRANQNPRANKDNRKHQESRRKQASNECLIDARLIDGEVVVVADIPGASRDDISTGITPRTNELVIAETGTVIGRVDLPWPSPEIQKAKFKNGILEIHMKSADSESLEESSS